MTSTRNNNLSMSQRLGVASARHRQSQHVSSPEQRRKSRNERRGKPKPLSVEHKSSSATSSEPNSLQSSKPWGASCPSTPCISAPFPSYVPSLASTSSTSFSPLTFGLSSPNSQNGNQALYWSITPTTLSITLGASLCSAPEHTGLTVLLCDITPATFLVTLPCSPPLLLLLALLHLPPPRHRPLQ